MSLDLARRSALYQDIADARRVSAELGEIARRRLDRCTPEPGLDPLDREALPDASRAYYATTLADEAGDGRRMRTRFAKACWEIARREIDAALQMPTGSIRPTQARASSGYDAQHAATD
jgi:hypothetical protein